MMDFIVRFRGAPNTLHASTQCATYIEATATAAAKRRAGHRVVQIFENTERGFRFIEGTPVGASRRDGAQRLRSRRRPSRD